MGGTPLKSRLPITIDYQQEANIPQNLIELSTPGFWLNMQTRYDLELLMEKK
jgi:hypothetical protein